MQVKRRNLFKGILIAGVVPMANASGNQNKPNGQARVVQIRTGYYSVNGVIVTELELQSLREDGVC